MIKVDLIYEKNALCGLTAAGHAMSAACGKDLVCAAVSAIITGGFNAFSDEDLEEIALEEGFAKVRVRTERGRIILNTIVVQLKTVESSNPNHIRIKQ